MPTTVLMRATTRIPLDVLYASIRRPLPKMIVPQKYNYFLILDFEATCEKETTINNQEIIEFPVLKVDAKTYEVTNQFHHYVRPLCNPFLSVFCTQLTGITQEAVDESCTFSEVMKKYLTWMAKEDLCMTNSLFVTCGDWDLKYLLPQQCTRENIELPDCFKTYMNIKKVFANVTGKFTKGMMPMLQELNLPHTGRLHSGIDDCANIANILHSLAKRGVVFEPTMSFLTNS